MKSYFQLYGHTCESLGPIVKVIEYLQNCAQMKKGEALFFFTKKLNPQKCQSKNLTAGVRGKLNILGKYY